MSTNVRVAVAALLCMGLSLHTKVALSRCNVDEVFISGAVISSLTSVYGAGSDEPPCRDRTCRAARDVLCSFSAMAHLDIPNSLAYDTIQERDHDYASWLAQVRNWERRGAARAPLYCAQLAKVAAQVVGDLQAEVTTLRSVVELAARLDRHGVRCSPIVMAALPRTDAVRNTLVEGANYCWEGLKIRCRRIAASWPRSSLPITSPPKATPPPGTP